MAKGVNGSFAGSNPRVVAGAGRRAFIAGPGGIVCAAFVWQTQVQAPNNTPSGWVQAGSTVLNTGSGAPTGFVANEQEGTNNIYLSEGTFLIQAGNAVVPYVAGDFWAISATATTIGQKVFAYNLGGATMQTAATGSIITNYTETQFYVGSNQNAGELFLMSSYPQH
jgi:hypothetical protein